MNNSYEPKNLFEINLYNFIDLGMEQEIISVKIISYEGIIVSFKNKSINSNKKKFNPKAQEKICKNKKCKNCVNYYNC